MIDWQNLRYFVVLAQRGTFSGAARELGVDHATIARRVAALENELGVKLIDRLPRQIVLRPEGSGILELAISIGDTVQAIERRAHSYEQSALASVRVTAPPALAARLIAPGITDFQKAHPNVAIVLSGSAREAALDRNEADIGVRLSRPRDPDIVARRIGIMRFALYATPHVASDHAESWTFIGYDAALDHVPQQEWLKKLLNSRPIVFRASDLFSQQEAARTGVGAVVLPCFMGDPDKALTRLPVDQVPPTRDIWIATYPDLKRSQAVQAVMDFLAVRVRAACPLSAG